MCRILPASVFMAYGNLPDLSPGGNLPVCNNEKLAESGETAPLSRSILMSTTMRLCQITIRRSLKIILDDNFYLHNELLI